MKIYTLGTSHGNSTYNRWNSSTLYETKNGALYLIDAGAPVEGLIYRKGKKIDCIKSVFITHMHDDHVGGLPGLIKQKLKYTYADSKPITVILPEARAIDALKIWLNAMYIPADSPLLQFNSSDDGVIYRDEQLTVTAIRTRHLFTRGRTEGEPVSFAYLLDFAEGFRVLHTGDLNANLIDFPEIAFREHFDVCVMESTHYKAELAVPILEKANFSRVIFNHVGDAWHTYLNGAGNIHNGEEEFLQYFQSVTYPVSVAHDGDEFVF